MLFACCCCCYSSKRERNEMREPNVKYKIKKYIVTKFLRNKRARRFPMLRFYFSCSSTLDDVTRVLHTIHIKRVCSSYSNTFWNAHFFLNKKTFPFFFYNVLVFKLSVNFNEIIVFVVLWKPKSLLNQEWLNSIQLNQSWSMKREENKC